MFSICCFDLTRAVRFIAMFGLISSVIMINLLVYDFLHGGNSTTTIEAIIGLEWRDFVPFEDRNQPQGQILPRALLLYAIFYMMACLALMLASILQKIWCTIPWFICETMLVACQLGALIVHALRKDHQYQTHLLITTSVYLIISLYFWLVVFSATKIWCRSEFLEMETYIRNQVRKGDETTFESPKPYRFNSNYNEI